MITKYHSRLIPDSDLFKIMLVKKIKMWLEFMRVWMVSLQANPGPVEVIISAVVYLKQA